MESRQRKEHMSESQFASNGKNAIETFEMVVVAFGEQTKERTQVFKCFSKFKTCVTSIDIECSVVYQ